MVTQKPAILILTDGLFSGGMERQIVELLRGLRHNRRFRTVLAVLTPGGELETEAGRLADTVIPIRRRTRFDATPLAALVWGARITRTNLIHTFGWMSGMLALPVARLTGLPVINGSIRAAPPRLMLREQISRWSAALSDCIVANSRAGLVSYGFADSPRAHVIYNGLNFERFYNLNATHYGEPCLCMVANFSRYKDHPAVLQALPIVRREFPQAHLVLVGRDREALPEIQNLVEKLQLSKAVTFVCDTDEPAPIIAGSDVCILMSRLSTHGEGISNAMLEYMALGKPLIATASGGNFELVHDGKTGYLIENNNPNILAERILQLLRNPTLAKQMGEAGQRYVMEHFSIPRMVAAYEALYTRYCF